MDKYQVMLLLVVYYIIMVVTTAVFSIGTTVMLPGSDTTNMTWDVLKIFVGGLFFTVPGIPAVLWAIVNLPFWVLLAYFMYLNLPLPLLNRSA